MSKDFKNQIKFHVLDKIDETLNAVNGRSFVRGMSLGDTVSIQVYNLRMQVFNQIKYQTKNHD